MEKKSVKSLRDAAVKIGFDIGTSAEDIAQAMKVMAKVGRDFDITKTGASEKV